MTRTNFMFLFLLLISSVCKAQPGHYFEGEIVYKFEFTSSKSRLSVARMAEIYGPTESMTFKEGNIYITHESGVLEFLLYNKEENRTYYKKRGSDTVFFSNCAAKGKKLQELELTEKKETILGVPCEALMITYKDHTVDHYYNTDSFAVDPGWSRIYIRDGENLIAEMQKAIYLKEKIDYRYFTVTSTAIKVTRRPVDDRIFKAPAGVFLWEKK